MKIDYVRSVQLKSIDSPYAGESCEFDLIHDSGKVTTVKGEYCMVPIEDSEEYDFPVANEFWRCDVSFHEAVAGVSASNLVDACRQILAHHK